MKKQIAAVVCAALMLTAGTSVFAAEAANVPQRVYQEIEEAGLTVKWLDLDNQHLYFTNYYSGDGYFDIQSTDKGEHVKNRYGEENFYWRGGYGKVDLEGNIVIPFEYDSVSIFKEGMASVYQDMVSDRGIRYTVAGAVNESGELAIPMIYDSVDSFSEGLAAAATGAQWHETDGSGTSSSGGLYGYLDKSGTWVIEPQFSYADFFHDGVAVVSVERNEGNEYYSVSGLTDKEGRMVVDFDRGLYLSHNRGTNYYTATDRKTDKEGLLDSTGKVILSLEYTNVLDVKKDRAVVQKDGGKFGLIDLSGKTVIPFEYDEINGIYEESELIAARRWVERRSESVQLTTYFDWDGSVVIPESEYYGDAFKDGIATIYGGESFVSADSPGYMDYRQGAVNKEGKMVIAPRYQWVEVLGEDRLSVSLAGLSALFDEKGNRLTAFQYGSIGKFENGLAVVRKDEYFGVINKIGKEVVPCVFTNMSAIDNGKVMVSVGTDPDDTARIGILSLSEEMAAKTDGAPNFIRATLDGNDIPFDQDPVVVDGRTLVPMRAIFEEMGAKVDWSHEKQTVTGIGKNAAGETVEVVLTIGEKTARVNGEEEELDVAAALHGGRTFVPLRFVAESMGMDVVWSEAEQLITITRK